MKKRWRQLCIALLSLVMVCALAACGTKGSKTSDSDKVLFSYDGTDVTLKEAWIYTKMLAANYEAQYSSYFGENFWTMAIGQDEEGKDMTFEDSVKEQVISQMKQIIVLDNKAKELKCSLSEDDKKKCEEYAKAFAEDDRGKAILEECGGKQEDVQKIYEDNALASQVQKVMVKDVDKKVSAKESRTTKVSRIVFETTKTDDQGQQSDMSEKEKKEVLKKAETVLASVKKGTSLEDAAKEQNYSNVTETFTNGESEEGKAFEKIIGKMKDGDLYDKVIEADNGYVIVRLDAFTDKEATAQTEQGIIQEREQKLFQDTYDGWTKDLEKKWDYKKDVNQELWAQVVLHKEESTATEDQAQTAPAEGTTQAAEATTKAAEATTKAAEATTAK